MRCAHCGISPEEDSKNKNKRFKRKTGICISEWFPKEFLKYGDSTKLCNKCYDQFYPAYGKKRSLDNVINEEQDEQTSNILDRTRPIIIFQNDFEKKEEKIVRNEDNPPISTKHISPSKKPKSNMESLNQEQTFPIKINDVVNMLKTFRCNQLKSSGCMGQIQVIHHHEEGNYFSLTCECSDCKVIFQYSNSNPNRIEVSENEKFVHFREVNVKTVLATVLSGGTYQSYLEPQQLSGSNVISEKSWYHMENAIWEKVDEEAN